MLTVENAGAVTWHARRGSGTPHVRVTFNALGGVEYGLKFDLVAEGVTWFEPTGSPVEIRPLSVRGG